MATLAHSLARLLLLVLPAAGALGACTADSGTEDAASDESEIRRKPNQVQMNDVSVLFPLAKTAPEMAGHVAASAAGVGGPLLPAKLYTDASGQPKSVEVPEPAPHHLSGRHLPGGRRGRRRRRRACILQLLARGARARGRRAGRAARWDFRGFDVDQGKTTKPMFIPTLPSKTTAVSFFAGFGSDLAGGFTPPTTPSTARAATSQGQRRSSRAASCRSRRPATTTPSSAMRVINETASVVAYLNGSVLGDR